MSCNTVQIPLNKSYCITQGDTIDKVIVTFSNDVDIDLTTCDIKMQVYNGSQRVLDLSDGNGITVNGARELEIDKIVNNNLPQGISIGDLQVTDADGDTFTYFNIQYTISKQYTI